MKENVIHTVVLTACISIIQSFSYAQQRVLPKQTDSWTIQEDGSISWPIKNELPHTDHIEMAGEKVALWVEYGLDSNRKSTISRTVMRREY